MDFCLWSTLETSQNEEGSEGSCVRAANMGSMGGIETGLF